MEQYQVSLFLNILIIFIPGTFNLLLPENYIRCILTS